MMSFHTLLVKLLANSDLIVTMLLLRILING